MDNKRCEGKVDKPDYVSLKLHNGRCTRNSVVERESHYYCKTHDPVEYERRNGWVPSYHEYPEFTQEQK